MRLFRARKVKCDEGKPHCNRCTSTGRKCDGYAASSNVGNSSENAIVNKSGNDAGNIHSASANANANTSSHGHGGGSRLDAPLLLFRRPRQAPHGIGSAAEGRALQYFCEIAAPYMPYLPGVTDTVFWSQLVLQFSSFEPAVRHSIVAISSLYEQAQVEARPGAKLRENSLALRHYNAAISELKTMQNPSLVLMVCILFICIEFLQSNREAAIRHCKHGIMILSNDNSGPAWVREHLLPMFRRLSIFPFFFGTGSEGFPSMNALAQPIPTSLASFSEARFVMDDIFSRTVRLVRYGDPYRFGNLRYTKVPPHLLLEQDQVNGVLDQWQALFRDLETRLAVPAVTEALTRPEEGEDHMNGLIRLYVSICYETCRVFTNTAFAPRETVYDGFVDHFRRLLDMIRLLNATLPEDERRHGHYPKNIFEMGFLPMTFLLATKCRVLDMRLAALRLIKLFGISNEAGDTNIWEIDNAHDAARYVIGVEHGVAIDKHGQMIGHPTYPGPPPDAVRVREVRTDYKVAVRYDKRAVGGEVYCRVVNFYMRTPDDSAIYIHTESFPVDFILPSESPSPISPPVAVLSPAAISPAAEWRSTVEMRSSPCSTITESVSETTRSDTRSDAYSETGG